MRLNSVIICTASVIASASLAFGAPNLTETIRWLEARLSGKSTRSFTAHDLSFITAFDTTRTCTISKIGLLTIVENGTTSSAGRSMVPTALPFHEVVKFSLKDVMLDSITVQNSAAGTSFIPDDAKWQINLEVERGKKITVKGLPSEDEAAKVAKAIAHAASLLGAKADLF